MAKITGVANNDTGDEAKAKINEAMASVEVGSDFSGDGNTGSVLKFLGRIYNTARTFYAYLSSTNLTANRTLTIQDKDITIAGLTDIQKGLQLAIDLSATTAGNPGTGLARFNDSDQSAVTALYINNSEYGGNGSIEDFISILNADAVIKLTAQGNRAKWVNYKVSSVADNSTYYTISLTVANKGTDFESGDIVGFELLNASSTTDLSNYTTRVMQTLTNSSNVIDLDWNNLNELVSDNRVDISADASITYSNADNAVFATLKVNMTNSSTITFPSGSISSDDNWSSLVWTAPEDGYYTISIYKTGTEYEVIFTQGGAI